MIQAHYERISASYLTHFKTIPNVAGIYIFYRQTKSGEEEALYVGQSQNIRERFKQHSNSLKLVEGLEDTPQGKKMFVFAEIKVRKDCLEYALDQAERGYIQYLLDEDHPLLNKKLYLDKFDTIVSEGEVMLAEKGNPIVQPAIPNEGESDKTEKKEGKRTRPTEREVNLDDL